jgi:hypothetical protein
MSALAPPRFLAPLLLAWATLVLSPARAAAPPDDVEATGVIEALGAADVTVGGYTFAVTAATEIRGEDGDLTIDDLALGMLVEAEGSYTPAGLLVAEEIEVEDGNGGRVEVEGRITALADSALTVGGVPFRITGATEIRGPGDPTAADLAVGIYVEVRGHFAAAGAVADRIEIEEGDDEVEVRGPIEALGDASLTVQGHAFAVTPATRIEGDDHQPMAFEDLAVGVFVEVHGAFAPDGGLVATRVEVEGFGEDEVEFTGAVEALDDSAITVSGLTFAVTDQTAITDDQNHPIPFGALVVGMVVEIRGAYGPAGVLTATDIHVEDVFEDEVEAKAALDAVADSTVVLLGRPFLVGPATRILGLDGQPIALADLAAGQVVEVHARLDVDGSLVALRIERDDTPADHIRLKAAVTAVGAAGVEVVGVAFVVDDATVILDRDGDPATLADLAAGQRVDVDGVVEGGVRRATRIEIERAAQAAGLVSTVGAGGFGLPGLHVTYDAATLFVDEAGRPFSPGQLAAGHVVRVYGTATAAATVAASRVVASLAGAVGTEGGAPAARVELGAPAPNPVAGTATLRYTLAEPAVVSLTVLDALGREVRRLVDAPTAAGAHEARFDAAGLPAGVYVVRLTAGGASAVRRVTVVR